MLKLISALIFIMIFSGQAFAGGGDFDCTGKSGKRSIRMKGSYPGLWSLDSSKGTLYVDGREVARFRKGHINISKFKKTVKAANDHGEVINAKLLSLTSGEVHANVIMVPSYGIYLYNVKLVCEVYQ